MQKVLNILIYILTLIVLVDPGDEIFGIKLYVFLLIFLFWFFSNRRFYLIDKKLLFLTLFISIVIPTYSFLVGYIFSNTFVLFYGLKIFKAFLFFSLLIVTSKSNNNIEKYIIFNCFFVALITIGLYYAMIFHTYDIYKPLAIYFDQKGAAFTFLPWSQRAYGGYIIKTLFYKTSSVMIFPLAYHLYLFFKDENSIFKNKIRIFLILFFWTALLISGTRANILSSIFLVFYFTFGFLKKKYKKLYYYMLISIIAFFVIISPLLLKSFFSTKEQSNKTKIEYYNGYMQLFSEQPSILIFGQGIGSEFYSNGNNTKLVYQTELTYLELIRMLGLPLAVFYIFILVLPLYIYYKNIKEDYFKNKKYIYLAYFCYLIIAGTNPLLLSSTGMIVLVTIFTVSVKYKYSKNENIISY